MAGLKGAAKGRQTQWATQFLAAAELIRRGYTVSFTQGNNTPIADLMVGSPSSKLFWVDVKGLSAKNAWLITPKESRDDLFYVLVLLSRLAERPKERVRRSLLHFDARGGQRTRIGLPKGPSERQGADSGIWLQ